MTFGGAGPVGGLMDRGRGRTGPRPTFPPSVGRGPVVDDDGGRGRGGTFRPHVPTAFAHAGDDRIGSAVRGEVAGGGRRGGARRSRRGTGRRRPRGAIVRRGGKGVGIGDGVGDRTSMRSGATVASAGEQKEAVGGVVGVMCAKGIADGRRVGGVSRGNVVVPGGGDGNEGRGRGRG